MLCPQYCLYWQGKKNYFLKKTKLWFLFFFFFLKSEYKACYASFTIWSNSLKQLILVNIQNARPNSLWVRDQHGHILSKRISNCVLHASRRAWAWLASMGVFIPSAVPYCGCRSCKMVIQSLIPKFKVISNMLDDAALHQPLSIHYSFPAVHGKANFQKPVHQITAEEDSSHSLCATPVCQRKDSPTCSVNLVSPLLVGWRGNKERQHDS